MNKGLPLSTGVLWLKQGWKIIAKAPLSVLGIVSSYLMLVCILSLTGLIPGLGFLGVVVSSLAAPFGAMAIVSCGRDVCYGKVPLIIPCWGEGWKNKQIRIRLLCLGLFYGLCVLIIGVIFDYLSAPYVSKWVTESGVVDSQTVLENIPWTGLVVGFVCYGIVICATCFSPMLITWKGQTLGKAIFFSLFVCIKNFGALIVLVMSIFLIALLGSCVLAIAAGTMVGSFLLVLWGLFITSWAYTCLWPIWESVFGPADCVVPSAYN